MNKYILWAKKHQNALFFLIIVALSSIFRLTNLDLVEFKADEASNLLLATRIFFDHPLPYAGTATSVGILNPPFFIYLLIPLTLISLQKIAKAKYKTNNQTIFDQKVISNDYFISDKYCGTSYSLFKINDESYQIEFVAEQHYTESKDIKRAMSIIDDIVASLRIRQ